MGLFKRRDRDDSGPAVPAPEPDGATPAAMGVAGGMDLDAMKRQAEQLSATVRQQGFSRKNLGDLTKFALDAQAQAKAQMAAVQQASTAGGVGGLMAALGMDYGTDYVKKVECPSCGAPKKLASASAYLYCDYCGALADYDFRRACEDSASAMPGPEYVQLVNSAHGELTAAKAAGDQERYRAVQQRIFDAYVTACPKAVSHRVGDPAYRAQLVAYMAESSVVNDFDPEFSALMDEMKARVAALEWTGSLMARRTGGPSFRALVDVCQRQAARANRLAEEAGLMARDPDHASDAVRERMHHSLFSQGWLPMLEQEDAAWLIEELKLKGEYTKIDPPLDGESRSCGGCGGDLTALPGARTVVCNHCGRSLDVGGAQSACANCGAGLSFPAGVNRLPCPYCKTETERVGWT